MNLAPLSTLGLSGPLAQRFDYRLRIAANDGEIGAGRRVGLLAALFPIPEGAQGNVEAVGEFFLRQAERPADDPDARRSLHPRQPLRRQGLRVRIAHRGGMNFFIR